MQPKMQDAPKYIEAFFVFLTCLLTLLTVHGQSQPFYDQQEGLWDFNEQQQEELKDVRENQHYSMTTDGKGQV
jgi:hypothetical protein